MLPTPKASVREFCVLGFAMVFPTVMAWAYFVALARPAEVAHPPEASPAMQAMYTIGKLVQFALPVLYLGLCEPRSLRPVRPSVRGLSFGLGFGAIVALGMLGLYRFVLADTIVEMGTAAEVRAKVEEFGAGTPGKYLLLALFLSGAHSLLEEYYWRWFVFGRLRRLVPVALAIAISSLAFMAHHVVVLYVYLPGHFLSAAVPFSLSIAVGGAVWAWLYNRTGAIYSVWLSHLLVDVAIMAVGYDLMFGK